MGQKHKLFREFRTPFPLRDICENPRSNVRACAAGDGAICSKNRKIVPYHGANPNTRNGARLRSPSLIMALGCTLESAIWSGDTGQQIPCFDRCQLIITWVSDIKEVHGKPRLQCLCQPNIWSMAAMLRDSVAVVVRTRPRAMPLAMITMRKSTHGFPFLSHMSMGLCYKVWA